MNNLQKALATNALFSSLSGLTLLVFHTAIAELFEVPNSSVFWIIGCLLLFFSLTIVLEIYKQRKWAVIWIIIQDYLWVVASVILILLPLFKISTIGNLLIAMVAIIVFLMAINQTKALKKQ